MIGREIRKTTEREARAVSKKQGAVRMPPLPVHFAAHALAVDTLLHPHLRVKHLIFKPDDIGGSINVADAV